MNGNGQRIAKILTLTSMALMLLGCGSLFTSTTTGVGTAPAVPGDNSAASNPDFAVAQATLDAGQGQLSDLSRQSTDVSFNMTQASNASARSTQDDNQRQKLDLDFQATAVSLNMAHAAATQQSLKQQTQMVINATAAVQSSAAAATQSAYQVNVTQTAHAQGILDVQTAQAQDLQGTQLMQLVTQTAQAQVNLAAQVVQTDQAVAALTTGPMTATPLAMTQQAGVMQEYAREQQSFADRVATPLIPVAATLLLLLFVLVIILAYRRFLPPRPLARRLLPIPATITPNPLMIVDGVAVDRLPSGIPNELTPANPPRLAGENIPQVEIVAAAEPPVAHWIAEVESQLDVEEGPLP